MLVLARKFNYLHCANLFTHQSVPRITYRKLNYCTDGQSENKWPSRVISGIQPTGTVHLGNYFGAIQRWVKLQNEYDDCSFFIADYHSITLPMEPQTLRENSFEMLASLLACGINPSKSTLFVQSSVPQQTELSWILGSLSTLPRLSNLPQFKEKSAMVKDVNTALFTYPVLQAADILAHKATIVPCGEDQIQQLQLAQHLARLFNNKYGKTFPIFQALIAEDGSSRIRSLRDPSKKQSKSEADSKSRITLRDPPDVILDRVKKSVTDCTSAVTFDPNTRPGVSNLITIHSMATGLSEKTICEQAKDIDTGKYKFVVAEALINLLNPIRLKLEDHLKNKDYLLSVMKAGHLKAAERAENTLNDVKNKVGFVNL